MTTTAVPTLTTTEDAHALLRQLAITHEWVSVFWDRGWGDSGQTAEITIIADGDGNDPKARLTKEVYRALVTTGVVGENSYGGFKARRIHDYCAPKPAEKTGPTSNEIAERVIRGIVADHPDLPIRAQFWRGVRQPEDIVQTPAAADGWWVLLLPGHSDVAMSAQEPTMLGPNIIGGGIADCVAYPCTGDEVDLAALAGDNFRDVLMDAIRSKVEIIAAARSGA